MRSIPNVTTFPLLSPAERRAEAIASATELFGRILTGLDRFTVAGETGAYIRHGRLMAGRALIQLQNYNDTQDAADLLSSAIDDLQTAHAFASANEPAETCNDLAALRELCRDARGILREA